MLFTYGINRLYTVHKCIMWAIELPFTVALPYTQIYNASEGFSVARLLHYNDQKR